MLIRLTKGANIKVAQNPFLMIKYNDFAVKSEKEKNAT